MNYEDRWNHALADTVVGKKKIDTVLSFIESFRKHFGGNGPVVEEIAIGVAEVTGTKKVSRSVVAYYIERLEERGLISSQSLTPETSQRRIGGRIISHENDTGTIPEQNTE